MNIQFRRVTSIVIGVVFLSLALLVIRFVPASTREIIPFQPKTNEEQNTLLIADLKANLKVTDLSPEDRSLLEGKLAGAEISATREALYGNVDPATAWAEKQTSIAQATSSPIPDVHIGIQATGIVPDRPNPGFGKNDVYSSFWVQDFQDSKLFIFVGHVRGLPDQGVISIVIGIPKTIPDFRIVVPGNTGALHLKSEDGDWLIISSKNGSELKFNRYTYQLIDVKTGKEIPIEITENIVQEGTAYP